MDFSDDIMLLSYINTKLRDEYPSLEALCEELEIERDGLEARLRAAGYCYNAEQNRFI